MPDAIQGLISLDHLTAKRVNSKVEQAAENPYHYFKRLAGEEYYKLKVGDYRVLARFFHSKSIISIEKLGHRKNVYDRL